MKIYCDTNQFPALTFFGPHPKPCDARGLSMHYNLIFDQKLVHGICTIRHIPCACVACTSMLDQPWIYGIPKKNHVNNLSHILLTGKFWDHITIGISFI